MSGEPGSRDIRGRLFVLGDGEAEAIRPCSRHDELETGPLKFSLGSEVYVTPDDRSLYFCPSCSRDVADDLATGSIVATDEAIPVILLSLSGRELRAFTERLANLGRGTVQGGDVYLADNPRAEQIPDWLYEDGGVYMVDERRVRAEEDRADEEVSDLLDGS